MANAPIMRVGGVDYNLKDSAARTQITSLRSDTDSNIVKLQPYILDLLPITEIHENFIVYAGSGGSPSNQYTQYYYTNFIAVDPSITYFSPISNFFVNWYSSNDFSTYISTSVSSIDGVISPSNANYAVISANLDSVSKSYLSTRKIMAQEDMIKYITDPNVLSVFNSWRIPSEYYYITGIMSNDGKTIGYSYTNYGTTDFIEIRNPSIKFTGRAFPNNAFHTFDLYDKNYNVVYHAHGEFSVSAAEYPTAKYFRASTDLVDLVDDYYVYLNIGDSKKEFHIGANQEYTTLKAGIAEAIKYPDSIVYVHSGVYDLTTEFAAEIAAASGSPGITLANNVHVIFMAGSYVKALFAQSSEWISTYFEPFRGKNFTLDGLNIEASNCRYCVHDEQGGTDVQYHNVYKNCIMKMTDDAESGATFLSPQCIGGGLGTHGYIEIIGGHYTSLGDSSNGERPAISYHNGSTSGCDSRIFIRDVYLAEDGFFRFGYYGTSTTKSKVFISGCDMGAAIMKRAETPSSTVDNFEITEWNNINRAAQ